MNFESNPLENIREKISKQRKIIKEMQSFINERKNSDTNEERDLINSQLDSLQESLKKSSKEIISNLEKINVPRTIERVLAKKPEKIIPHKSKDVDEKKPIKEEEKQPVLKKTGKLKASPLEKIVLKRIKKKKEEKTTEKKEKTPSKYIKISSKVFHNFSMSLINKGKFKELRRDLVKSNLEYVPAAYLSALFFSTTLSAIIAFFLVIFFIFFNLSPLFPFVVSAESGVAERLLTFFWLILILPSATFIMGYFFPTMERKSLESQINRELPFATIHMSSISGSMVDPSKIFQIIISTGEYPNLKKEFTKLQNEINIYGYDIVTSLKNRAMNSPSRKLSDLFNGLATTITSGGNLPEFFEKRAQSLLFDYKIFMEKQTKASETFMDIYISVVIAAPMVLMLLLMMMRISGLGIALSPLMITLLVILTVTVINIFFLTFLHLKQPNT